MARAKLGFSRFTVGTKILRARLVVSRMTGNPSYTTPTPSLQEVTDAVDGLEQTAQDALKGGTDKTLARNIAEQLLTERMGRLLEYVNLASHGDALVIESSGMDVQRERTNSVLLGQVQNVKATVGGNPQEIIVTWDGLVGSKGYIVEMKMPSANEGGSQSVPSGNEEDTIVKQSNVPEWLRIDTVSKRKLIVKNLDTGTVYSFRVAAFNAAGQGDYSQVSSSVAP